MVYKFILNLFILLFSFQLWAGECLLSKAMADPRLSSNQEFWKEYSLRMAKGEDSNKAIEALTQKFDPNFGKENATLPSVAPTKAYNLDIHKRAKGEIKRLPPALKKKVDGFLEVALKPGGIKEIRDNPGKWHYEKLIQFGPEAHSVRLNDGYRVLFDLKDGALLVREVNKGHIHGN